MDVIVLAVVLVGLAAFVAAPLYSSRVSSQVGAGGGADLPTMAAALEDLEVDRASGLYDESEYADELRTLQRRQLGPRD
ncbi:MAG: hypothetical protein ACRDKJ_10610 [Actinomycetota bacterium]